MILKAFMIIFFILSIALFIWAVVYTVCLFRKRKGVTKRLMAGLILLFGSVLAMRLSAGCYMMTGAYSAAAEYSELGGMQMILDSVVHGLQSFSMDEDYTLYIFAVQDMCMELFGIRWIAGAAGLICSVQNVLAPVAGGAVLLDILANIFPSLRLALKKGTGMHNFFIFSELNEDAVCLAEDIIRNENYKKILAANGQTGRPVIIFTDSYLRTDEETHEELKDRANVLGAICIKTDILCLNLNRARSVYYFLVDSERMNNLSSLAALAEGEPLWRVRSEAEVRGRTASAYIYVFAEGEKSGAYIRELRKKNRERLRDVVVREVQDYRSMAMNLLYHVPLYVPLLAGDITDDGKQEKKLVITILGSGRIGEEVFRNVYWYGQFYDHRLEIHVIARNASAMKQSLMRNYEELLKTCRVDGEEADRELLRIWPECSGRNEVNPPYADVYFRDYDIETEDFFAEYGGLLKKTHYFVAALGSDRKNMEISGELNRWLAKQRLGNKYNFIPVIACAVFDARLGDIVRNDGESEDGGWIIPFGSHESRFSCRNVFLSDFTERSLAAGQIYDKQRQEKDADDEYKTLSTVARVAHASYKYFSEGKIAAVSRRSGEIILESGQNEEELSGWLSDPDAGERLAWIEHRRWNAYIRAQGYVKPVSREQLDIIFRHGENGMNPKRVDIKIHPCLVEAGKMARRKGDPLQGLSYQECDLLDCLSLYLWQENRFDQGGKKREELTADDYDYKVWDYPEYDTALSSPAFCRKET